MSRQWTGALGALLIAACASGSELAPALAPAEPADLVIRDVRMFDGETVVEAATVVVRDGRIVAAGPRVIAPAATEVVDGRGHTLLPGLIDAHTHTFAAPALEAALALGVTTVLDMFTAPALAGSWKLEQEAGRATGRADIISAGVLATADGGHGTQYGMPIPTVDSPADASRFVTDRVAEGSAFLKVVIEDGSSYGRTIPTLDAPRVNALVTAAHDHDIVAVAHVARIAGARMALDAGADGLVHVWTDRTPDAAMVRRMASAGMFVVPTLTVLESTTGVAGGATLLDHTRVASLIDPDAARNLGQAFPVAAGMPTHFDSAMATVTALHRGGVRILAGSDAPNPGTTHGASIHRELELLVRAGLTPLEALRAATSVPADAFDLDNRGRIRPGARADLLLVEGDPTSDVLSTRAIARVWKGGVAFEHAPYAARMTTRRSERAAAAAAGGRGPGLISDFDDGTLGSAFGTGWSETTDAMMGGKSSVQLRATRQADGDAASGALHVAGDVVGGVPYPWSGAMWFPGSRPMAPVNLSGSEGLAFRSLGDGQTYQVLLFHEKGGMAPVVVEFTAGPRWSEHLIPWSQFGGADGSGVMGIAFVAGGSARTFSFWVDDVALR